MHPKLIIRKSHRWLAIVLAIQFLAWTIGGFYFSLFPIQEIRGSHLVEPTSPLLGELDNALPAAELGHTLISNKTFLGINSMLLHKRNDELVYSVHGETGKDTETRIFNAFTGREVKPLNEEDAVKIALKSFKGDATVASVTWIEHAGPHSEYRGRPLPAWKISLNHESGMAIYVAAYEGKIAAHRSDKWRVFDFLWMLHTMDYFERDNFNTPWLNIIALLAIIMSLSGILLWYTSKRKKPV